MELRKKQLLLLALCVSQLFAQQQQQQQEAAEPTKNPAAGGSTAAREDYSAPVEMDDPDEVFMSQQDEAVADDSRWKRHIGSVAAFGGLSRSSIPVSSLKSQRFSPHASPLMTAQRTKSDIYADLTGQSAVTLDLIKDKRYPDSLFQSDSLLAAPRTQWESPLLRKIQEGILSSGSLLKQQREFSTPTYNEARSRALHKLLRLLADLQKDSPTSLSSKSKKFLGALARSNGLPSVVQRPVPPQNLFKGSTAIPLPGKRVSEQYAANPIFLLNGYQLTDSEALDSDEYKWVDELLQDGSFDGDIDDEVPMSEKRHLASVAKAGWGRPSRLLSRYN